MTYVCLPISHVHRFMWRSLSLLNAVVFGALQSHFSQAVRGFQRSMLDVTLTTSLINWFILRNYTQKLNRQTVVVSVLLHLDVSLNDNTKSQSL